MKPTKMRNNMIYRATFQTKSKQLGSSLSKDLRKKYKKRSVRAIEGDSITILRGEFRGVEGKISKVSTQKNSVAIEGVKKEKTKGDKFDVYIHTSNLMVTSLSTDDKWRISKLEGKNLNKRPKETPVKDKPVKDKPVKDKPVKDKPVKEEPKETKVAEKTEKKEDEN